MKPGDLVTWNNRLGMNLPSDIGVILKSFTLEQNTFADFEVLFGDQGILQCLKCDLWVIREIGRPDRS